MKILMICNTDGALYLFRKPIIKKIISLGHEVITISSKSIYFDLLEDLRVKPIALEFSRHSLSPIKNFRLIVNLYSMIKLQRPDIVHNFTHKPAIYGTIAARFFGVKRIFITITGLGTVFSHEDTKSKLLCKLLLFQYKFAIRFAAAVFFQNPDDRDYFVSKRIISREKALLTCGSGLDLSEYPSLKLEEILYARSKLDEELGISLSGKKVLLFAARGVKEKGFFEYYESARVISKLIPNKYLFLHAGLIDEGSISKISKDRINKFAANCNVHYLGFKDNIKDYMSAADVVVLPSSYREGTPRSLIEALALGKCIVTTDTPGCRETVIDGWNGYLSQGGDVTSLVSKILLINDSLLEDTRKRSRTYCEYKYDVEKLIDITCRCYFREELR